MKNIILTGACGFVGNFLKKELIKKNYFVIGVDKVKDNFSSPKYKFVQLNLDNANLDKKFKKIKIDFIIHLSAISTDKLFNLDPKKSFSSNINSTLNLLDFANKKKINNFIFASSEWIYGNDNGNKKLDENLIINRNKVISSYGISKLIGEDLIINFYNNKKISNFTILRFGIVFGPRKNPSSAIEGLLKEVNFNKSIEISGSDKSSRKFIYILDLISGIIKSLNTKKNGVFNLSNDKLYSLKNVVSTSNNILKKNKKIKIINKTIPIIRNVINKKFKKEFSWKPKYNLKKALIDLKKKVDYV
jgi:nucleoside-diphosphate-sugar epimerase